jgi:hypothetical protein
MEYQACDRCYDNNAIPDPGAIREVVRQKSEAIFIAKKRYWQ